MERVIHPMLAESLERNRPVINTLYELSRAGHAEPDSDELLAFFLKAVSPVYEKGLSIPDALLAGVFREILELEVKGYIGKRGRFREAGDSLFETAASLPELIARERGVITSLFNALINLYSAGSEKMTEWKKSLMTLDFNGDFGLLKKKGLILAWRYGAARFRESALSLLGILGDAELKSIFGTGGDTGPGAEKIIASLNRDPWFNPGSAAGKPVFLRAGGFTGYGGVFRYIPEVFFSEGDLFASDGINTFRIYADSYGVELVPVSRDIPAVERVQSTGTVYGTSREIILDGKAFKLPENTSGNVKSSAVSGNTVIWSEENSCKINIAGLSKSDA